MKQESFGNRIKELRELRGMTQLQLAEKMLVSRSTIANWETGNRLPDIDMLAQLAGCLNMNISVLMNELQKPDRPPKVIVVEDLPVLLNGFVRMLREELPGAEIRGFRTGKEALAYAREEDVSAAFLDIELGGEDGIALARELTSISPYINIIFLTSHQRYAFGGFCPIP